MRLNLTTLLIAKYSDLLGDGARSPKNFHEQVLRLTGDTPLNVFATINNRFSLAPAAADVHATLEHEFLSDSAKNKLARVRRRETDDVSHIVFTRYGALITLKLLLGTPRLQGIHRLTAIGACALHANDYTESADVSDMSSELLPLVAEYAAT